MFDVAVIGGGIAGMATAARLQARGVSTVVIEAHSTVGGCAGYFRHRGFSFDVGATTFVDFAPGGAGANFCDEIGMDFRGEFLPGYVAWLPDRTVTLHRDHERWSQERLAAFGSTPGHIKFWELLDRLADTFWQTSRCGVSLPLQHPRDVVRAARSIAPRDWPLARYLASTMGDALRRCGLEDDVPLRALLGMLIQDTVHSSVDKAPLINAALGVTIRGAGLTRPVGGARGFFEELRRCYAALGGELHLRTQVEAVRRMSQGFSVDCGANSFLARQVISTLPIQNTAQIGPSDVVASLQKYLRRDNDSLGGALVLHLGVPESEVAGQEFTHHQILTSYDAPLGNGKNMFISVSAPDDRMSAPDGHRAVMISTHCELAPWECFDDEYVARKQSVTETLLTNTRMVYPTLGRNAVFQQLGTPRTYARFTHRWRGAVGGVRQTLRNSNQFAVPADLGLDGFWLGGDTTWPGLGTVAAMLSSHRLADNIAGPAQRGRRVTTPAGVMSGV